MWNKIQYFPCLVYAWMTGLVQDFKNDERGLSGVVVSVLLILVSVLAVVAIWGFMSGWLIEMWEKITGKAAEIP